MKRPLLVLLLLLSLLAPAGAQSWTCGDTLTDPRDGKKYATVPIGSDCWFRQNLNYGTYVQSDSLGVIHSQQLNNGIAEKYAQQNDTNNFAVYGGLYEQSELMNYSTSPQGLCPAGWHVSTDAEWQAAITAAGGALTTSGGGHGGNALKALGEGFGAGTGTDLVGLSAKHGGDRDGFGIFYGMGLRAIYWTSTIASPNQAYHYTLWAENDTIERLILGVVTTGFSCRCVKDQASSVSDPAAGETAAVSLYPNPAAENVSLSVTPPFAYADYRLYNTLGQVCRSAAIRSSRETIALNELPPGTYFLVIRIDDTIVKKKLVVAGK